MTPSAPLQVLLFRHVEDQDVLPFEEAIVRAIQGGKEAGGYLASGEDLGVQLEIFQTPPPLGASHKLDSFCHTLVVVLFDRKLLDDTGDALWDWLAECWTQIDASNGRHSMLVFPMDERIGREFIAKRSGFRTMQVPKLHEFGEPALRPAMVSLRLLHECRILLATGLPSTPGAIVGYLRLLISHAKMDGLPLAHALKHQISEVKWLRSFYDADDLPPGRNWERELERAVGSSLIVMLRGEFYESRHWCQQEVLWADEYAVPAVVVEARTGLNHPGGFLPFERVPSVRIPDGNLLRILFLALREGLRSLHFMRRVELMKQIGILGAPLELRVFSFAPSMSALLRACRSILGSTAPTTTFRLILYPDPPLRAGLYEAAQALLAVYAPGTHLLTPNTIAAMGGRIP